MANPDGHPESKVGGYRTVIALKGKAEHTDDNNRYGTDKNQNDGQFRDFRALFLGEETISQVQQPIHPIIPGREYRSKSRIYREQTPCHRRSMTGDFNVPPAKRQGMRRGNRLYSRELSSWRWRSLSVFLKCGPSSRSHSVQEFAVSQGFTTGVNRWLTCCTAGLRRKPAAGRPPLGRGAAWPPAS